MGPTVQAINADDITKIGVGTIVVLVIIGLILGALITKLIVRAVIALVVVVLAVVVWQQRGHVKDEYDKKACGVDATYFGVHVDPPGDRSCPAGS
jgi:uncharacterized membrane protein